MRVAYFIDSNIFSAPSVASSSAWYDASFSAFCCLTSAGTFVS